MDDVEEQMKKERKERKKLERIRFLIIELSDLVLICSG